MAKEITGVQWEIFQDESFYDFWAVRPKKDIDFNSPRLFHFQFKEDGEKFLELIEKSHHAVLK